jgi:flagellar motility protein MotE (MotC chaperone)
MQLHPRTFKVALGSVKFANCQETLFVVFGEERLYKRTSCKRSAPIACDIWGCGFTGCYPSFERGQSPRACFVLQRNFVSSLVASQKHVETHDIVPCAYILKHFSFCLYCLCCFSTYIPKMVRQTVEIFGRVRPFRASHTAGAAPAPLKFVSETGVPYDIEALEAAPDGASSHRVYTGLEVASTRGRPPTDTSGNKPAGITPTSAGLGTPSSLESPTAGAALSFRFNRVFDPSATQEDVYRPVVAPLIDTFLSGINCTILAYGQTGSGKTWTMCGGSKYKTRGLIPRAIGDIFAELEKAERITASVATPGAPPSEEVRIPGVKMHVSYMEIYNENVYDLLDDRNGDKPIELWERITVREGKDGELHLKNLRQYQVNTERDVLNLLFLGNVNRMTAETPMNHASSRSHCIFTLSLERRHPGSDVIVSSKFNLVDLAGSERIFKTGVGAASVGLTSFFSGGAASDALLRKEGKYINLSLHHLEQVIIALQSQANRKAAAAASTVVDDDAASHVGSTGAGARASRPTSASHAALQSRGRSNSRGPTSHTPANRSRTPSISALPHTRDRSASAHVRDVSRDVSGKNSRRTSVTSAVSGPTASVASVQRNNNFGVHIPYRNSTLTSVLRDSLGGNCKTVLVATLNPEPEYVDESVSTCRFAVRCGQLANDVQVNESRDLHTTVQLLQKENLTLLRDLDAEKHAREALEAQVHLHYEVFRKHGIPTPTGKAVSPAKPATSASSLAPADHVSVVDVERRHDLEVRIANCIRAGVGTYSTTMPGEGVECTLPLRGDGSPGGDGTPADECMAALYKLVAQLKLTSLSDAYTAIDLLMDAVKRAVGTAAEASAEVDHERARLQAAATALSSLRTQLARQERDLHDWESRHSALLGEYNTLNHATAGLTNEIVSLQQQLAARSSLAPTIISPSGARNEHRTGGVPAPLESRTSSPMSAADFDAREDGVLKDMKDDGSSVASLEDNAADTSVAGSATDHHHAKKPSTLRHHPSMASSIASDITSFTRKTAATEHTSVARAQVLAIRELLVTGALFVKHGRQGSPHLRFVWVDGDFLGVHWRAVGKDRKHSGRGSMAVSSIIEAVPGRKTSVFSRQSGGRVGRDDACFSLIAADRTLDLEVQWPGETTLPDPDTAVSNEERLSRDKWVAAFRVLILGCKKAGKKDRPAEEELGEDGIFVPAPLPKVEDEGELGPVARHDRTKSIINAMESSLERHARKFSQASTSALMSQLSHDNMHAGMEGSGAW